MCVNAGPAAGENGRGGQEEGEGETGGGHFFFWFVFSSVNIVFLSDPDTRNRNSEVWIRIKVANYYRDIFVAIEKQCVVQ